uniref:Uncharacterized protein n=1 Tax=Romanomermis culicivorax TaxID=13658 RepID=A0A915IDT1_ROMCU
MAGKFCILLPKDLREVLNRVWEVYVQMAMTLALIVRIDRNDRKLATISTKLDQGFHSTLEPEKAYSILTHKHDKNYYLELLKNSLVHVFKANSNFVQKKIDLRSEFNFLCKNDDVIEKESSVQSSAASPLPASIKDIPALFFLPIKVSIFKNQVLSHEGETLTSTSAVDGNKLEKEFLRQLYMINLKHIVKGYSDRAGRDVENFVENELGKEWCLSFLKRHENALSQRFANNIKRSRVLDMLSHYL